jgi:amino acid transporter
MSKGYWSIPNEISLGKQRHAPETVPEGKLTITQVVSFADAGEILFKPLKMGAIGREVFGGAQTIFLIFTMASHILTWTICLNTVSDSATCTVVWAVIGLVIFWLFDLPRTLKNVSFMSIASFISIFSAVLISMIAIGIQKPRGNTPLAVTTVLPFTDAFVSVSNIVFAYAGHSCFFGFLAEMKNPAKDWTKALIFLQIWDISLYIIAATVIYVFAGPDVTSPALGSAGPIVRKVAWGIAIPTVSRNSSHHHQGQSPMLTTTRSSLLESSMDTSLRSTSSSVASEAQST